MLIKALEKDAMAAPLIVSNTEKGNAIGPLGMCLQIEWPRCTSLYASNLFIVRGPMDFCDFIDKYAFIARSAVTLLRWKRVVCFFLRYLIFLWQWISSSCSSPEVFSCRDLWVGSFVSLPCSRSGMSLLSFRIRLACHSVTLAFFHKT